MCVDKKIEKKRRKKKEKMMSWNFVCRPLCRCLLVVFVVAFADFFSTYYFFPFQFFSSHHRRRRSVAQSTANFFDTYISFSGKEKYLRYIFCSLRSSFPHFHHRLSSSLLDSSRSKLFVRAFHRTHNIFSLNFSFGSFADDGKELTLREKFSFVFNYRLSCSSSGLFIIFAALVAMCKSGEKFSRSFPRMLWRVPELFGWN